MPNKKRKTIGLALGGGGARGFAHIGILDVLNKEGIKVDYIAGASSGAIIGALYALGISINTIKKKSAEFGSKSFFGIRNFNFLNESLFKATRVDEIIERMVHNNTFKNCKIPFRAVAVDLEAGNTVIIKDGPLKPALMASSAIPSIFPPVFHQNKVMIDGGLINNLPLGALEEFKPDITIGVCITNIASRQQLAGAIFKHYYASFFEKFLKTDTFIGRIKNNMRLMTDTITRSLEIATSENTKRHIQKHKPDLLLSPDVNIKLLEFEKGDKAIKKGRKVMKEALPKLLELLK